MIIIFWRNSNPETIIQTRSCDHMYDKYFIASSSILNIACGYLVERYKRRHNCCAPPLAWCVCVCVCVCVILLEPTTIIHNVKLRHLLDSVWQNHRTCKQTRTTIRRWRAWAFTRRSSGLCACVRVRFVCEGNVCMWVWCMNVYVCMCACVHADIWTPGEWRRIEKWAIK